MHGLTLLSLVFVIVEDRSLVSTSTLVSKEDLEKVNQVFPRDIIDINEKEIGSRRQRRYFEDFYWEEKSPAILITINMFRLMLVTVVALVMLN